MRWRSIFRDFPRVVRRSGIILCLVIVSAVSLKGVAEGILSASQLPRNSHAAIDTPE